jgi:hypothetical protein
MPPSLWDLSQPVLVPVNALVYRMCPYYSPFVDAVNSG